jgi:hypothetical protein
MLVDIHIADVRPGQTFHYAGRAYVMVTDMDTRHPAQGMGQILAYHAPERGDRVPVSFNAQVRVFVEKKK